MYLQTASFFFFFFSKSQYFIYKLWLPDSGKFSELRYYIQVHSVDVIALTEVQPKVTSFQIASEIYQIEGYSLFSSDLNHGRGTLICIKEAIGATDFNITDTYQEYLWCKLSLASGDKLVISCIYRSPHWTAKIISKLYDMLINVCARNISHILILGDFNFKEIDWNFLSYNVNETHPAYRFFRVCKRLLLVSAWHAADWVPWWPGAFDFRFSIH